MNYVHKINVFIITNNYYLFRGIEAALEGNVEFRIVHIEPDSPALPVFMRISSSRDILLLISDGYIFDINFLIAACKSRAGIIYSTRNATTGFHPVSGFVMMHSRFYMSDLLQAIYTQQSEKREVNYLNITSQEKRVLYHTIHGETICEIGRLLSISRRTVYLHQRNAIKKIGFKKTRDLINLPKNLIDTLYSEYWRKCSEV